MIHHEIEYPGQGNINDQRRAKHKNGGKTKSVAIAIVINLVTIKKIYILLSAKWYFILE